MVEWVPTFGRASLIFLSLTVEQLSPALALVYGDIQLENPKTNKLTLLLEKGERG